MAHCKRCEGWGFERDPASPDGWARDAAGSGIVDRKDKGGCGGTGAGKAEQGSLEPTGEGLPEQRG